MDSVDQLQPGGMDLQPDAYSVDPALYHEYYRFAFKEREDNMVGGDAEGSLPGVRPRSDCSACALDRMMPPRAFEGFLACGDELAAAHRARDLLE